MTVDFDFALCDKVVIDNSDISGFVGGCGIFPGNVKRYQVEWIHNGVPQTHWMDAFRLKIDG